jgi:hypothetical protein
MFVKAASDNFVPPFDRIDILHCKRHAEQGLNDGTKRKYCSSTKLCRRVAGTQPMAGITVLQQMYIFL